MVSLVRDAVVGADDTVANVFARGGDIERANAELVHGIKARDEAGRRSHEHHGANNVKLTFQYRDKAYGVVQTALGAIKVRSSFLLFAYILRFFCLFAHLFFLFARRYQARARADGGALRRRGSRGHGGAARAYALPARGHGL